MVRGRKGQWTQGQQGLVPLFCFVEKKEEPVPGLVLFFICKKDHPRLESFFCGHGGTGRRARFRF